MIFAILIHSVSFGQEIIDRLVDYSLDRLENYRLEEIKNNNLEENYTYTKKLIDSRNEVLRRVFKKIEGKYNVDFSSIDTLYIIEGYDLESGHSDGRIWNKNDINFRFEHTYNVVNYKVKNEKIRVYKVDDKYLNSVEFPILEKFDPLINLIEKKDTAEIFRFELENESLSGWEYTITILEREKNEYNILQFNLSSFWIEK